MRKRTLEKASSFLDERATEIERLLDGPQMFKAVHLLQRRQHSKLTRISDKVDDFLPPSQSGFRRGRSTADVIWGYRWLVAKCQRYKYVIEILGIDLSRAFDTIRREKLLSVLYSFLGTDNV
ncbi:hypothetical protein NP493_2185g00001 [Ridgeia piscesae]|uniref:Reverse transcriptase domain-containing protein n=1 Tax=Ridgeia piscesae TaxID=27915 RepID=A0AAD9JJX1_RIDPI|nr:hypothetical protein NP493_2185g00001 [Ridgeia piscesae]